MPKDTKNLPYGTLLFDIEIITGKTVTTIYKGEIELTGEVTLSDSQNISGEKTFSTAPKTSKKYDSYEDIFDLSKFESGELSKDAFLLLLEAGLYGKFTISDTEIPSMKSVAQMIGGVLNAGLGCKLISDISYETCTYEELQEAIKNSD